MKGYTCGAVRKCYEELGHVRVYSSFREIPRADANFVLRAYCNDRCAWYLIAGLDNIIVARTDELERNDLVVASQLYSREVEIALEHATHVYLHRQP